jgi:hypothetical protein
MNRMKTLLAGATVLMSAHALADPSTNRPLSPRHQLVACMTRQMTVNRTLSYNDASKMCKAQLKSSSAALASAGTKPVGAVNGLGR